MAAQIPEWLRPVVPHQWVKARAGETRVGQVVAWLELAQDYQTQLTVARERGAEVALVGVPESIGPRANHGRGGAEDGWPAFLQAFLNLQATPAMPVQELLLVGSVDCDDLMQSARDVTTDDPEQVAELRALVAQIDDRVQAVVQPLFAAGFEVLLIGGGHNNAYPLLKSLAEVAGQGCGAINLDPHADFRMREGRHSGNGFNYAHHEGALQHYHIMSLHEGKNTADSMRDLNLAGFNYHNIHELYDLWFVEALQEVCHTAKEWQAPLGIEVDLDAITQAPASAYNLTGVTMGQSYRFVAELAALASVRYLHLAEGAPACDPAGHAAGMRHAGQLLSELAVGYLRGRTHRTS